MKTWQAWWMAAALTASSAAWADAPEYLLGDLGVRVDLPGGWKMTRWSDWDFKGESTDGAIFVFAWATPFQVPIEGDVTGWSSVIESKVTELGGKDPKLVKNELATINGRPVALLDVEFSFGSGGAVGHMYGATLTVAGQNLHLAAAGSKANAKRAEAARKGLVERLEVKAEGEPLAAPEGAKVSATGVETTLPAGWRAPFEREVDGVAKLVSQVGIEDPSICATALRPRAGVDPDVMVTCKAGLQLGMVDEYTFADVEPTVRARVFGKAEVPAARPVALADRTAFLYTPDIGAKGIAVSVVPYDQGVALTWFLGQKGDATLGASAEEAAKGSTYSGPHPVTSGEMASYYVSYRPTHPYVLGPAVCGLLGLGVAGAAVGVLVVARSRRKPADEDEV